MIASLFLIAVLLLGLAFLMIEMRQYKRKRAKIR